MVSPRGRPRSHSNIAPDRKFGLRGPPVRSRLAVASLPLGGMGLPRGRRPPTLTRETSCPCSYAPARGRPMPCRICCSGFGHGCSPRCPSASGVGGRRRGSKMWSRKVSWMPSEDCGSAVPAPRESCGRGHGRLPADRSQASSGERHPGSSRPFRSPPIPRLRILAIRNPRRGSGLSYPRSPLR